MNLLSLKLILTPLLIVLATLAARRWGPMVGGWLAGLPLTSGPVSIFLVLEQGRAFAAQAARGTLLGLIAVSIFCVAYARSAKRSAWLISSTFGLGAYLLATWGVSFVSSSMLISSLLVLLFLCGALMAIGLPSSNPVRITGSWWDLPLRMATATAMVLLITGGAKYLGAKWSGLLSPFPVFACVMAIFSHRQDGAVVALHLLRGVVLGSFAFASFFIVVGLVVERASPVLAYTLATSIAVLVNGLSLATLVPKAAGRRIREG
jgi:hypothetical protein